MICATASPALLDVVEAREQHLRALRLRQQLHGDFGDDAEHAFRAGEEREQVEAGRVERVGAERQTLAVDRDDLDLQDVVDRQAVLQAMHAAGVLRDVAADRARDLRRRIGRVVQAVRRGGLRDREIAHAGLHARGAGFGIDDRGCG